MSAVLANLTVAAAVLLTGLALLLAVVGFLATRRVGHSRLAWVTLAFVLLTVQGAVWAWQAYQDRGSEVVPWPILLSFGVVVALYFAVLKR